MITLELRYFARFKESFGKETETLTLTHPILVADLLTQLRERGGLWEKELQSDRVFRVAVNHQVVSSRFELAANAEVALFPPVTGG